VVYSIVPRASRFLVLESLDAFHDRQGGQSPPQVDVARPATWARVMASRSDFHLDGPLQEQFVNGHIYGVQGGADVYARETGSGHQDRLGLFFTYAEMAGDIDGFALGKVNLFAGRMTLNGASLGAYWTHAAPKGWYIDGVYMHSWLIAKPMSTRGIGFRTTGEDDALSLEGGYPFHLSRMVTIEPQGQVVWQALRFGKAQDPFSSVDYRDANEWAGRVGLRVQARTHVGGAMLLPYVQANVWHYFSGADEVNFDGASLASTFGSTAVEFGGGVAARVSGRFGLWAGASYTTAIAGPYRQTVKGDVGLRFRW
jgi:outer membrane autotransporter protein